MKFALEMGVSTKPLCPALRPSFLSCPAPGLGAGRGRKGRGPFPASATVTFILPGGSRPCSSQLRLNTLLLKIFGSGQINGFFQEWPQLIPNSLLSLGSINTKPQIPLCLSSLRPFALGGDC